MSRPFTPQELEEYNRRRNANISETADKLGVAPEQLNDIEQKAREELTNRQTAGKAETEKALHIAISLLREESPEAPIGEKEPDSMSAEEFGSALSLKLSVLDDSERQEAIKATGRKIACWRGGEYEPLSLREEILLDLQSMIKRHNYYAEKEK